MHRVRMNLHHYAAGGWEPTVLAVAPAATDRLDDPRLLLSIPGEISVTRTQAVSKQLTGIIGLSAIGLRAYHALAHAGDLLIAEAAQTGRPFDLAFFSTTAFPTMALGPRWQQRFGVPYVLDMQDPWFTAPAESQNFRRSGLKHRAMRAIHALLEPPTMRGAAGLIAVSPRYIEVLRAAYPTLRNRPAETIPFGWSRRDMELARSVGRPWSSIAAARRGGALVALSAGRANATFETALRTLFRLMHEAPPGGVLASLRTLFLGTGYQGSANQYEARFFAAAEGVEDFVEEQPDRLPLLDALASLEAADVLVVLGSDDRSYQPSRLHQYLAFEKPVLVVAPSDSRLAAQVEGLTGVIFIKANAAPLSQTEISRAETALAEALLEPRAKFAGRAEVSASYESAALAERECALFSAAHEQAARDASARTPARSHG